MPDPVPAVAAPAAIASPAPQPSPAPGAGDTPPSPPKFDSKKVAGELFRVLTAGTPDPTDPQPAKPNEPEKTPVSDKKAEPVTPAPADKGIKVRKAKPVEEARPELPKKAERHVAAPAPAAAAPVVSPAQTDADFEKELVDEERALLDDARAAEKYLPDKYKGQSAKMTSFLKEATKKEDAAAKGDISESELREWYESNRPKISALDFRTIERARVKEDVTKEFEPKLDAERHARWTESESPKIKAKGDALYSKLVNSALPDEVAAAIKERTAGITDRAEYIKAVQGVEKDYALETEITQNVVNAATNDLEEFHRLTTVNPSTGKALATFQADNPQHDRILKIVSDVCNDFKSSGGTALKKDGKWFATREEWSNMADAVKEGTLPLDELSKWWTFSNDEIVDRALGNVKGAIAQAVSAQRKTLEDRYGFKRTIAAAAAPSPVPAPASGAPPAPRPSPVPAAHGTATPSLAATLASKLTSQPAEG